MSQFRQGTVVAQGVRPVVAHAISPDGDGHVSVLMERTDTVCVAVNPAETGCVRLAVEVKSDTTDTRVVMGVCLSGRRPQALARALRQDGQDSDGHVFPATAAISRGRHHSKSGAETAVETTVPDCGRVEIDHTSVRSPTVTLQGGETLGCPPGLARFKLTEVGADRVAAALNAVAEVTA